MAIGEGEPRSRPNADGSGSTLELALDKPSNPSPLLERAPGVEFLYGTAQQKNRTGNYQTGLM